MFNDNNIQVQPLESGLYFIETQAGTGAKVDTGKTIKINYTGKFVRRNRFRFLPWRRKRTYGICFARWYDDKRLYRRIIIIMKTKEKQLC
jgi:hypothetical protein